MSNPIPTPKDGGPAFPETRFEPTLYQEIQWSGMSLLDFAAIKAMQAMLSCESFDETTKKTAVLSYDMAEAMIAEKAKREAGDKQN